MRKFLIRRFLYVIVTVLLATVIVFALSRMTGDPRYLYLSEYSHVTEDVWEAWGKEMGLDKPLVMQYLIWLGNAVKGDWGNSIVNGRPAFEAVMERLPATLQLTAGGFIFALLIGIPLGVLSAVKRGSVWDYIGRAFAILGQSLPSFWLAIVFILVFAVILGWLPTSGMGGLSHYILPSVALGWVASAGFLRLTRSSMLDVLDSEFVKYAKAKGVNKFKIVWKHAFRNAIIAPLTYAGLLLASFATGSVVIETIFAWPGLGLLAINAVYNNDFPVLTGAVLVFAVIYVLMAFVVDITYAFIDPRIRYG
jgi:peptide/nickel transport system permease protein